MDRRMTRRAITRLTSFAVVAGIAGTARPSAARGRRAEGATDPAIAPRQSDSPQTILQKLLAGNARYARSEPISHHFAVESRAELAGGQAPAAAVLCCADSRVGPELVFDQPRSTLFVCRVAGNTASDEIVGSLEYAVKVLGSKLVVVLGHSQCSAVKAALELVQGTSAFPPAEFGQIGLVAQRIAPAVRAVEATPSTTLLIKATDANAVLTAAALRDVPPILAPRVHDGSLAVVSARYDLETGRVVVL
jgi:carbonic anhydrase